MDLLDQTTDGGHDFHTSATDIDYHMPDFLKVEIVQSAGGYDTRFFLTGDDRHIDAGPVRHFPDEFLAIDCLPHSTRGNGLNDFHAVTLHNSLHTHQSFQRPLPCRRRYPSLFLKARAKSHCRLLIIENTKLAAV